MKQPHTWGGSSHKMSEKVEIALGFHYVRTTEMSQH